MWFSLFDSYTEDIKTIKLLKEISHTMMMNLDSASAVHLLEVALQRCATKEWREVPDVLSEEGKHSPIHSVIFFFSRGAACVYVCVRLCGFRGLWVER